MKIAVKIVLKLIIALILTLLTQIGGVLYILIEISFIRKQKHHRIMKSAVFLISYSVVTFFVIPFVAPLFGREKIIDNELIDAHTFFTKVCNRNYVTPKMNEVLKDIAIAFQKQHPGNKLVYLDANFPFIKGFPLPPHLSHNDGKKIDISFIYSDTNGNVTNKKPAILGYGAYTTPVHDEYDQIKRCKNRGYWQYDITKYLTLGMSNNTLKFSEKATKDLLLAIVKQSEIHKVFLEPHLKKRLQLNNPKIRFHGCQAVRHDDHIHIQLK